MFDFAIATPAARKNKCVHVVRVNVCHETTPAIPDKRNDISFSAATYACTYSV